MLDLEGGAELMPGVVVITQPRPVTVAAATLI